MPSFCVAEIMEFLRGVPFIQISALCSCELRLTCLAYSSERGSAYHAIV